MIARILLHALLALGVLLALPMPSHGQTHVHGASEQEPVRVATDQDMPGHTVHDNGVNYYVLLDELEWQGSGSGGLHWDNKGWIGRDIDRLWFRSELSTNDGNVDDAEMHVMYGRAFSPWWEIVGGVRQDFPPGSAQTWAAIGVQGLLPYWLEVEVTGYVGAGGRTALRLETETDLLITNRLILQPLIEVNLSGKSDPERGVGSGLRSTEIGLRWRYEIRRELAPYVGIAWNRKHGDTADLVEAAGDKASTARLVVGIRAWF